MAYECDDDIDRKQYEVNQAYEEIAQEVSSDKRFDTGESFVNEDRGFQARYTFTGKELDKETGYQYFGSRYNEPARLGYLSVDPLSDKYPSLSPYVYCANNPIKCIDPDGREVNLKDQKLWHKIQRNYQKKYDSFEDSEEKTIIED